MNFTGEMLVSDSIDPQINLDTIGSAFNDIFLVAHEVTTEVGLKTATEICFETPQQLILMICSGRDAKAHIHLLTILDKEGNLALVRMTMGKLLPRLMEDEALLEKIHSIEERVTDKVELVEMEDMVFESADLSSEQTKQALVDDKPPPSAAKQEKPLKIQTSSNYEFLDVLIVHDSAVIGKKMELEFDKLNIQPDLADSLERATKLINRKKYDIVFSGATLYDGNGYQICRMIKKDPAKKHWAVILLSGNPSPYERVRSRLAGYDGYFSLQDATSEKLAMLVKRYAPDR